MTTSDRIRQRRRATALVGILCATTTLACGDDVITNPKGCPVTAVEIAPPSPVVVYVGDEVSLTARTRCGDGSPVARSVTWVSDEPNVARVSSKGTVRGVQPGAAIVSAFSDGPFDAVEVTVLRPVGAVMIVPASIVIPLNAQIQLTAVLTSDDAVLEGRTVAWASSDPAVAAVTATGLATALAEGTTTVTATSEGQAGTAVITVRAQAATVTIDPVSLSLFEDEEATLVATVRDASGLVLDRVPTWATSNETVATVSALGVVRAGKQGLAVITASHNGVSGSAVVVVRAHVARVAVTPDSVLLQPGQSVQLTAMAFDANAALLERPVEWASADAAIATVAPSGLVTGVDEGKTTVDATIEGITGSVIVVVQQPVVEVVIATEATSMLIGDAIQLTATPKDQHGRALNRPIAWTSAQPQVATVSATGMITGVGAGVATISATAGGTSGSIDVTVKVGVVSLTITNVHHTMGLGEQLPLSVQLLDQGGQSVQADVTWTSSDASVATVDSEGAVTAVSEGTIVVHAESEGVSDEFELTVAQPAAAVVITKVAVDEEDRPVMVGGTMQLLATVLDAAGAPLQDRHVIWSSGNEALATIDQEGLVTGVARGLVTITARSGNASGTLLLRVAGMGSGGSGEEGLGNNLSVPVVFAEGIGLSLLPVLEDPGLRPTTEEGIVATSNPFWHDGNVPDCETFYCQKGTNTWRAEWKAAVAGAMRSAQVCFGDNLTHHTWNTHSPIRVEVALRDQGGDMQGFEMPYLVGTQGAEMAGTNGVLAAMQPTIYTPTARLMLQKLENYNPVTGEGEVSATVTDVALWENLGAEGPGQFKAEVNVAGRVILGYSFVIRDVVMPVNVSKYGWWRITLALDSEANVGGTWLPRNTSLDSVLLPEVEGEPLLYTPRVDTASQRAWLDIYIVSASGGGSSGGGTSGGGCGGSHSH